jgi:pimeloyl-ACP methyl ester carboxylesterase
MNTGSLTRPTQIPNTIVDNAQIMGGYVEGVRDQLDAQNVDLVAHSMGGLISREYVETAMGRDRDGDNVVNRLVMLGTPNQGSPCASILPLAGMYELRPEVVATYNQRNTNKPGVPMSVLAGKPLPFTCDSLVEGDGVVEVPSAITGYADTALNRRIHTALTKGEDFAGFVLPRLTSAPARSFAASRLATAQQPAAASPQLLTTTTLTVAPGATAELPLQVDDASAFGASYVAPPSVTATLVDGSGRVVASSTAGDDAPCAPCASRRRPLRRHVLRLTQQRWARGERAGVGVGQREPGHRRRHSHR